MDAFRWISTAVSIILGFGVTRLLSGVVLQFQARRRVAFYWPPLAWATAIFVQQIGFWWSLGGLADEKQRWTLAGFLLLIVLALGLFLAAALVLPQGEGDLKKTNRGYFEEDGRWALPVLAAFNALAIFANWELWRQSPLSVSGAENVGLALLPLVGLAKPAWLRDLAAAAYLLAILAVFGTVAMTPFGV